MSNKLIHRITAGLVFLISSVVLFMTVQPSVSFWDCGEFSAAARYLQVPHPPGTPFFLILGRVFMMIPFVGDLALRFNTVSVLSSALSILFLYLVAVKLIESMKGIKYTGSDNNVSKFDAIVVYIIAAIGALSFSFSDTFWFNAVESEVYAFSTLFLSSIIWLIMVWNEKADKPGNEAYLVMIAFLIGLTTGVHLMAVLAIVPIIMIIGFRKYMVDEEFSKKSAYIFLGHAVFLTILAFIIWANETGTDAPTPEEFKAFDSRFIMIFGLLSAAIMGIFYKKVFNRSSFYMPIIIGGIALMVVYPGIVKTIPSIIASIAGSNDFMGGFLYFLILAACGLVIYYANKYKKPTLNLSVLMFAFALLGFTTFAMVIIRSNQYPPMNENEPSHYSSLISYLGRDQYGDFPNFKRRFASEDNQQGVYTNYSSDFDFFWKYQMNHMMTRYWLWNYAGRSSWNQDAGPDIAPFNKVGSSLLSVFNLNFEGDAKDSLYGIPFLLGLLGIYFHFRKDWKMASVYMVLFIFMGYLTAFYQNQQQPQPRERDYFYVGAFFVYSAWISVGLFGLVELVRKKVKAVSTQKIGMATIVFLGIIFVPVTMLRANFNTHDRSKIWLPWDYAYNLLQSCAPHAVLFTNGDNDTFPLWFIQDVEGVRRDVKVVNLSLLNTDWYIRQLKNNDPYKVGTLDLSFTDDQIKDLKAMQFEPERVTIPGPDKSSATFNEIQNIIKQDSMGQPVDNISFIMPNTMTFGNVKVIRVQDIVVRDILTQNKWKRPIYFSITCSEDSKIGIGDYLKLEGMAFRLVPEKRNPQLDFVNGEVLAAQLLNDNPGYDVNYKPGLKFRGLNDNSIFYDENQVRMVQGYRNLFTRLASYYALRGKPDKAKDVLRIMDEKISRTKFPVELIINYQIMNVYRNLNDKVSYKKYADMIEQDLIKTLKSGEQTYYNPIPILLDIYDYTRQYGKAINLYQQFANNPSDPNYNYITKKIAIYQALIEGKDTTGMYRSFYVPDTSKK